MSELGKETVWGAVRQRYAEIAETGGAEPCCEPAANYQVGLDQVPVGAADLSLGCGDPIIIAGLQPGEIALDLGSGGGIDCFLAAERVGESGRVIGVDMTPEMVGRARLNSRKLGLDNVTFQLGQIESLPMADELVDVVISNCVINLSPDKAAVFREAFRVLRPGGRLAVADVLTYGSFGPGERSDMDAWSCCVSGAEAVEDYVAAVRAAGFVDVSVRDQAIPEVELADWQGMMISGPVVFSARVLARKPDRDSG
jgi:arsenite methyltransferase